MKKALVILGPTSTGKTDVALNLAKKFNGELISCDSRQVYKNLDIGTGKLPTKKVDIEKHDKFWVLDGVKIWMYDVISPKKQYTIFNYLTDAQKIIDEIYQKGKLPIIVGGSGLYLKALLKGLANLEIPVDRKLRKELESLTLEQLQGKLKVLSLAKWKLLNRSDQQNSRRLIRAIELIMLSPFKKKNTFSKGLAAKYHVLKIGLTASKEYLYKRVDQRVILRIKAGMIEEAKQLQKNGLSLKRMRKLGLEYGVLADYLEGNITTVKELETTLQNKIHKYVRRQQTWYKKETGVIWFNITEAETLDKLEKRVYRWYHELK
ncbi:tRNA (adenosine(37)-N6)-dimethylallyltransferase MiaA [Candidatus Daviesbacteria bacterium]|nr:tRNA (adenosine(37)-N6)-dimethylallyltransferase MiaA [Candidatus Daviesbacteria bacterium]